MDRKEPENVTPPPKVEVEGKSSPRNDSIPSSITLNLNNCTIHLSIVDMADNSQKQSNNKQSTGSKRGGDKNAHNNNNSNTNNISSTDEPEEKSSPRVSNPFQSTAPTILNNCTIHLNVDMSSQNNNNTSSIINSSESNNKIQIPYKQPLTQNERLIRDGFIHYSAEDQLKMAYEKQLEQKDIKIKVLQEKVVEDSKINLELREQVERLRSEIVELSNFIQKNAKWDQLVEVFELQLNRLEKIPTPEEKNKNSR
jgi:hypothetical protein